MDTIKYEMCRRSGYKVKRWVYCASVRGTRPMLTCCAGALLSSIPYIHITTYITHAHLHEYIPVLVRVLCRPCRVVCRVGFSLRGLLAYSISGLPSCPVVGRSTAPPGLPPARGCGAPGLAISTRSVLYRDPYYTEPMLCILYYTYFFVFCIYFVLCINQPWSHMPGPCSLRLGYVLA